MVRAKQIAARIASDGWADTFWLEDLLHCCGLRFAAVTNFAELLSMPPQTLFMRPRGRDGQTYGFGYTAAADVAALFIAIERLGFPIDPTPIVAAVKPTLNGKKLLTSSELRVLWFEQERHKCEPVTLTAGEFPRFWASGSVKLATGYKVEQYVEGDELRMLVVTAPRYRKAKLQVAA